MILQLSMTYRPLLDFHPGFPGSLILSLSLVRDISIAWVHGRLLAVSGCTSSFEFQGCVELGDELLPALLVLGPPSDLKRGLPVKCIVEIDEEAYES